MLFLYLSFGLVFLCFCRASIRQRSRSQLSNLIPGSSVPMVGELGPRAYSVSRADKSTVCNSISGSKTITAPPDRRTTCVGMFFSFVHRAFGWRNGSDCRLTRVCLCERSGRRPRGGGGTSGAGPSHQDPEVQHTRVALHALWVLRCCHKWGGQPGLLSAVQSNPGGEVRGISSAVL